MRSDDPQMGLAERLGERRAEIEDVAMARVYAVADPTATGDPGYVAGLREAVGAALDYALEGIDAAEPPPVPPALLAQARYAARAGVPLDAVLRRYCAGHSLFGEFVMEEARRGGAATTEELQRALRRETALLDRLLGAVTEAYGQEARERVRSVEHSRTERVRRLLAGELVEAPEMRYELGAHWHLGAIATGPGAPDLCRRLSQDLDRRLLLVRPGGETVWAWLGGRRRFSREELELLGAREWPEEVTVALGEPSRGLEGWRLTHRQALAALPVAQQGRRRMVRYADVALLAATLRDEVLSSSLVETYLAPLAQGPDRGATMEGTLRAYFAAERNVSATAAALGVSRPTVRARLRAIEEQVGRPLGGCAVEMEMALQLQSFE